MQIIDKETRNKLKTLKDSATHEDKLNCALALACNVQTVDRYLSGKGKKQLTAKAIIAQLETKQNA